MANRFNLRDDLSEEALFGTPGENPGVAARTGSTGIGAAPKSTPQAPRFSDAQKQGAANVVGGVAEAGADLIGGLSQGAEVKRARTEARRLADIQRGDDLAANKVNNDLRRKQQEQDEEQFRIQKYIDTTNLRHQSFLRKFNEVNNNRAILGNASKVLKEKVSQNQNLGNAMVNLWRR